MTLYTKTGDDGGTALFDGTRVPKDHIRVTAYGQVDELNATLGWCRSVEASGGIGERMESIQRALFNLGAELATPASEPPAARVRLIETDDHTRLEQWIDAAEAATKPLKHFVLPGGTELASRLHIARTVARRAERAVVALSHSERVRSEVIIYLNRLSDLLFARARLVNQEAEVGDVIWKPDQ